MSEANKMQVGGAHYKKAKIQHWDFAASNELDYFQGQITKYVTRWKLKNGMQDLEKAAHFLAKYIEIEKEKTIQMETSSKHIVDVDDSLKLVIKKKTEHPAPFGYDSKEEFAYYAV